MKNVSTIIAELRQRQSEIAGALKELERYTETPDTAAKIIAAVRKSAPAKNQKPGFKYKKGTHWMQTAKGRRILKLRAKKRAELKRQESKE